MPTVPGAAGMPGGPRNTRPMSATAKGKMPATLGDATRACLYAVVDRFNTDEPFWGSFVPVADLTVIDVDKFRVTLQGRGVLITVRGTMLRGVGDALRYSPTLVVGAMPVPDPSTAEEQHSPATWHQIACTVDDDGKFVTSNFRRAIESAIADLQAST